MLYYMQYLFLHNLSMMLKQVDPECTQYKQYYYHINLAVRQAVITCLNNANIVQISQLIITEFDQFQITVVILTLDDLVSQLHSAAMQELSRHRPYDTMSLTMHTTLGYCYCPNPVTKSRLNYYSKQLQLKETIFSERQHAERAICYRPSVCLSVHPSHGWISRKRLKLGSCNFHHTVAPSL